MAERIDPEQFTKSIGGAVGDVVPFIRPPERGGTAVGQGIADAARALAQWEQENQRKNIDASRQTPEERRMSRGAEEKGLAAFGQATATTPDTVSWHPLSRAAAMLSEFNVLGALDPEHGELRKKLDQTLGLQPSSAPYAPAQPLGQSYLRGMAEAEKSREKQMADMPSMSDFHMPSMPSKTDLLMALAPGYSVRHKGPPLYQGPPASKVLASAAHNVSEDLGNVTMAIPGLIAQTVLPRMKMPGETDEQAAARAVEEGRQMGRGVKQGLLGGTADILEHPLESAVTKPFTTAMTELPIVRGAVNLGKAGLIKAGVPAKTFAPPLRAESPILNRAIENLRNGLMEHSGPLGDMLHDELAQSGNKIDEVVGHALGRAVTKTGTTVAKLIDGYIAKFADGFYSGDPRVTVMAEEFARNKEKATASAKAAISRLAGGAAKELDRGPRIPPEQLPGLPGQAPAPIAPGTPPAPTMTMPPREPVTATGTPVADVGAAPVPAPGFLDEADLAMTKKARATTEQRIADLQAAQEMPEPPRPTGRFHGTSAPIDRLDEGHYDPRNIYGQGFYTTDSHEIAQGYTKKGRNGAPTIYTVEAKDVPLFDMERPMDAETRKMIDTDIEQFGMMYENAADNLPKDASLLDAYNHIRLESAEAGLSKDTVQEIFEGFRGNLERRGFSGLTHVGGKLTGKAPHNVTIFWNPEDVALGTDDWLAKSAEAKAHNERLTGARTRMQEHLSEIDKTLAAHEEATKKVAPAPEPNALGPQAPLLDRATAIMQDALKGHPKAAEYIAEFTRRFNEGHEPVLKIAQGLVDNPEFAKQFKIKAQQDAAPMPPEDTGVPVREQTQKERLYGAQGTTPDKPVDVPRDTVRAERAANLGPGVMQHVPDVVDEFMRHSALPEDARPALTQEVMFALEDALGGEGKTANWRGQMRGNPEQFAKDLIAAAEAKTGTRFTDKVKAQILDTIDSRDEKGLQLIRLDKTPDGKYEIVRTTRIPHQKSRSGEVFELHPENLVPARRLSAAEVRVAVQSQLEESMKDRMGATEIGAHVKSEGARALSETSHGPVPQHIVDVARDLFKDAVPDKLVPGVTDIDQAIRQVAQVAHNIIEGRRKGDVIAQILPNGMKATDVANVIREIGAKGRGVEPPAKVVPLFGKAGPNELHAQRIGEYADHIESTYGDEYTKHAAALRDIANGKSIDQALADYWPTADQFERGLERNLLNEMLDVTDPAKAPLDGTPVAPGEVPAPAAGEPGVVDTTAAPTPVPRLSRGEAKRLHNLAWEVQGYRPLHRGTENIGLGTKTEPIYGNVLLGDALKWHALSEQSLKDTGALGLLDKWFKSNNTNKSLSSGVNNFIPNISNVGMQYGIDPVTMLANGVDTLQDLADWHGKDSGRVDADNAKAFKNLDRAGLGMDFVQHELGDKAMTPSQVLRSDPFFGWLRNPGTDLPHTRAAKWFYRFGDQVIRVQEGVRQFKKAVTDVAGLKDGEFYDLAPTKRQQVRVTKDGGKYYVENPYALEAKDRVPTEVTADQLDQLIGKHAAHKSTLIVQDYPDIPQYPKMLTSSVWLRPFASPFKSYAAGAQDAFGKAGLVTNAIFRSPFAASTNNAAALARAGAQELRSTLGKSAIANGLRAQLVKQGANGPIANMFRSRPDEDQRIIIGNLMNPRAIEGLRMAQWANYGPTADFVGLLTALATIPEQRREHKLAAEGKLTRLGEDVVAADTGRDFNVARLMRMGFLSGGPLANMWDAVEQDAKAGRTFNPEKLTTTMANSLVGGLNASIGRSIAGYVSDTGPEAHPRLPVGPARELLSELSGRKRTTQSLTGEPETPVYAQPLIMYFTQQIMGKAFQAQDVNSMNPKQVKSILHKMGLSMKEGAGIKSEEAVRNQAKEDVAHAQPGERKAQAKLETQESKAQELTRQTIDQTVDWLWNEYQKTYRLLHGPFRPTGSK